MLKKDHLHCFHVEGKAQVKLDPAAIGSAGLAHGVGIISTPVDDLIRALDVDDLGV